MASEKTLDISWETILKVAFSFFCFYILYLIKDILILIGFSLIISILLNPAINFLQRLRVPRPISVIFIYILIFGSLVLFIFQTAPIFISEIQQFTQLFPQYFEKFSPSLRLMGLEIFENFETFTKTFQDWLIKASSSIFGAVGSIFGGIFSTITVFTLAIFLSLEEKGTEKIITIFSPKKYEAYILDLWIRSQNKVSAWFGARLLSCLFVGAISFLALLLFKIKYALALSLIAAITNIIPIVGPLMAGLIMAILAALDSPFKAIFISIVFILIQQVENSILTPILMRKIIGLPPVLVLIALMVGGKLGGLLGGILVIPLAGIIYEFLKDFLKKKKEEKTVIL